jgi:uncharacterized lipoprotein YehR (DUF1307 family)
MMIRGISLISIAALAVALAGCGNKQQGGEGPAERGGKHIDQAAQSAGDKVNQAAESTRSTVGEGAENVQKGTGRAMENAGEKLQRNNEQR